jgi:hypothetical protein
MDSAHTDGVECRGVAPFALKVAVRAADDESDGKPAMQAVTFAVHEYRPAAAFAHVEAEGRERRYAKGLFAGGIVAAARRPMSPAR